VTDVARFFAGRPESAKLFEALQAIIESLEGTKLRVTKSQIAFRRRTGFAWAWVPGKYPRGKHAPLVLSLSLRRHDPSPRWKEVVEPTPGRYMHHLELYSSTELDEEVGSWLREAWSGAGQTQCPASCAKGTHVWFHEKRCWPTKRSAYKRAKA
jgi:hypothetical protein